MKKRLLACAILGVLSFIVTPAQAYDWNIANAHIIQMEITYLPNQIRFMIDAPAGSCAVGSALVWNGHGNDEAAKTANVTGVYSALMTALATGRPITVLGNNADCTVDFIYVR